MSVTDLPQHTELARDNMEDTVIMNRPMVGSLPMTEFIRRPALQPDNCLVGFDLPHNARHWQNSMFKCRLDDRGDNFLVVKHEAHTHSSMAVMMIFKCPACEEVIIEFLRLVDHLFTKCEKAWRENMATPSGVLILPLFFRLRTIDDKLTLGEAMKQPLILKNYTPRADTPPGEFVWCIKGLWLGHGVRPGNTKREIAEAQAKGGFPYKQCIDLLRNIYLTMCIPNLTGRTLRLTMMEQLQNREALEVVYKKLIQGEMYSIKRTPKVFS